MAAVSQDRATVHSYAGAATRNGTAGEVIDTGTAVYLKESDGKYWTASNPTAAPSDVAGISLTSSAVDGPVRIQIAGDIDVGGTLSVGVTYWLGNADEIVPQGDLGVGDYVTLLGVATAADKLKMGLLATGYEGTRPIK